jgi:hypothetical protein
MVVHLLSTQSSSAVLRAVANQFKIFLAVISEISNGDSLVLKKLMKIVDLSTIL